MLVVRCLACHAFSFSEDIGTDATGVIKSMNRLGFPTAMHDEHKLLNCVCMRCTEVIKKVNNEHPVAIVAILDNDYIVAALLLSLSINNLASPNVLYTDSSVGVMVVYAKHGYLDEVYNNMKGNVEYEDLSGFAEYTTLSMEDYPDGLKKFSSHPG